MKARYAWIALLTVTACAPTSDRAAETPERAVREDSGGESDPAIAVVDGPADGVDERWTALAVPPAPRLDTVQLLLINRHQVPLVVFADGGAGEVLLDTVAATDSARVNVIIAADSVSLRAVGPDGTSGSPERVGLGGDSTRWESRF